MDLRRQNFPSKLFFHLFIVILLLTFICFVIVCRNQKSRYDDLNFIDEENFSNSYDEFPATVQINLDYLIFIKDEITKINENQVINNEFIYGHVKSSTFVVVIQVHTNLALLRELINSLKNVVGISGAYIIFSHEHYNEEINDFIANISFVKWSQIFYPYSTQLHPKSFPGPDEKFCTNDFVCYESKTKRRHDLAQKKHFWWWQTTFVFENLKALSRYENFIVFLEEGEYVLKDLLYMIRILSNMINEACPECEMLTFGTRDPAISQFHLVDGDVVIEPWTQAIYSSGFAFNRSTWVNIKKESYSFCHCDDYKWDVSLRCLGSHRPQGQFILLSSEAPRVLHLKNSSDDGTGSNLKKSLDEVVKFAWTVKRGLFPRSLAVKKDEDNHTISVVEEGNWADVRDRELCMYLSIFSGKP